MPERVGEISVVASQEERRSGKDRRSGSERRRTSNPRFERVLNKDVTSERKNGASWRIIDLRSGADRRTGQDRRT